MTRMVRKQIYITEEQEARLKERSRKLGLTEAEIVRNGINNELNTPLSPRRDLEAWERAQKIIRERMAMDVPQTGRQWTRDEIYDERLGRFSD